MFMFKFMLYYDVPVVVVVSSMENKILTYIFWYSNFLAGSTGRNWQNSGFNFVWILGTDQKVLSWMIMTQRFFLSSIFIFFMIQFCHQFFYSLQNWTIKKNHTSDSHFIFFLYRLGLHAYVVHQFGYFFWDYLKNFICLILLFSSM